MMRVNGRFMDGEPFGNLRPTWQKMRSARFYGAPLELICFKSGESSRAVPAGGGADASVQAGGPGKINLFILTGERALLDCIKDRNADETTRISNLELFVNGRMPFDYIAAREVFKEVAERAGEIQEIKDLAQEALLEIDGEESTLDIKSQISYLYREILTWNAEVSNIALLFIKDGDRLTQEGLIHFIYQHVLEKSGKSGSKVRVPAKLIEAVDAAANKLSTERTESDFEKLFNFQSLLIGEGDPADPTNSDKNWGLKGLANAKATTKFSSPLTMDVILEAFRDENCSVHSKRALTRVLGNLFSGRVNEILSFITTALGSRKEQARGEALNAAQIIFSVLDSEKKKSLRQKLRQLHADPAYQQIRNEIEDTLIFFELTEMVNPNEEYARYRVDMRLGRAVSNVAFPGVRVPEPAVMPENSGIVDNIRDVRKGHQIESIQVLATEYFGPADLRVRGAISRTLFKASKFFKKVAARVQHAFEAIGFTREADKRPTETFMLGNLAAFIAQILYARDEFFKFDKGNRHILLSKAGAGTRLGILGLIEDVDKGAVRMGNTPFEIMSLICASVISHKLKNQGRGMCVLTGCDQVLLAYGDIAVGLGDHKKLLNQTKNGLYIFTAKAECEGSLDSELKYICGLGNVLINADGTRDKFMEKPKTLAILRDAIRRKVLTENDCWPDRIKAIDEQEKSAGMTDADRTLGQMNVEDLFKEICEEKIPAIDKWVTNEFSTGPAAQVRPGTNPQAQAWLNFFLEGARSNETIWERRNPGVDDVTWKTLKTIAEGLMNTYLNTFIMACSEKIASLMADEYDIPSHTDSNQNLRDIFSKDPWLDWSQLLMTPMVMTKDEWMKSKGAKFDYVHIEDWRKLWHIAKKIENAADGLAVGVAHHFSDTGTIDEVFRGYFNAFHSNPYMSAAYRELMEMHPTANIEEGAEIEGVRIIDPTTTYIGGRTKLPAGTIVEPYTILIDVEMKDPARIPSYTVMNGVSINGPITFPQVELPVTLPTPEEVKPQSMRIVYDVRHDGPETLIVPPDVVMGTLELYDGVQVIGHHPISRGKFGGHEIIPGTGLSFDEVSKNILQRRKRKKPRVIKGGK